MAVTVVPLGLSTQDNVAEKQVRDTDVDATAEQNMADGPAGLRLAAFDNSGNAAITYFKFYNSAAPTVGTTEPEMVIPVAASARRVMVVDSSVEFSVALSLAGVTTAGKAGTTSPTSNALAVLRVKEGA